MDVAAFAESALIQASNVNFSGLRPSAAPPDVRTQIGEVASKTSDPPSLNGAASPNGSAMSVAKPLVAALPNPTMHKCLNHVQALAIAKADAEVVADATMPDASLWADGADAASQAFLDAFEVSEVAEPPAKKAKSAGGGASSGARAEKAPLPTTDDEWLDAHRRGAIAGFTNKVLQDFCISKQLKKTGKKDDLVARVTEYLDGMEREHGGDTSADAGADAGADADDAAENEVRDGAAVPTPTTSGESGTALPDIDDDF